jgi:hypothetical protein
VPDLISPEYRQMQSDLHRSNPGYGVASLHFAPFVAEIVRKMNFSSLLDYGAGKGRLGQSLQTQLSQPIRISHYDPAIPAWSRPPAPEEFVCCIDVLEHIEPTCLDAVLDDLRRVTAHLGFFTVHTEPAMKVLSDGRNAHLIQEPPEWWLPKLEARFDVAAFHKIDHGFAVLVRKKPNAG